MTSFLWLLTVLTTVYSCATQPVDQVLSTKGGFESGRANALSSRSVLVQEVSALNYESGRQSIDPNSYEYKIISNKTRLNECFRQTLESALTLLFKADYGSHDPGRRFLDSSFNIVKIFLDSSHSLDAFFEVAKKLSNMVVHLFDPERAAKVEEMKHISLFSRILADIFKLFRERIVEHAFKDIADDHPLKMFSKTLFDFFPTVIFNRSKKPNADHIKRLVKLFFRLVESDGNQFRHDSNYLLFRDFILNHMDIILDGGELSLIIYTKDFVNFILQLTLRPMNPLLDQLLLRGQTAEEIGKEIRLHWFPLLQKAEQFLSRVRSGDQEIPESLDSLFQFASPCMLDIITDWLNLILANNSGQPLSNVGHIRLQGTRKGLLHYQ